MTEQTAVAKAQSSPISKLKSVLSADSVKEQFQNVLKAESGAFIGSIIDLYGSDTYLQKCAPNAVILECLKAASLKLPINKNLGFAFIVPYKDIPQFQIGYKGIIQLSLRTGQFKYLNAGCIYEGQEVERNHLKGTVKILGKATSQVATGYFCYMELNNGFSKAVAITREEADAHGKKYSKAYQYDIANNVKKCPWSTNFDSMGKKTTVLMLKTYFPMTIEMAQILAEQDEEEAMAEIEENANTGEIIDMVVEDVTEEAPGEGTTKKAPF